jgi:hypothetical protein
MMFLLQLARLGLFLVLVHSLIAATSPLANIARENGKPPGLKAS